MNVERTGMHEPACLLAAAAGVSRVIKLGASCIIAACYGTSQELEEPPMQEITRIVLNFRVGFTYFLGSRDGAWIR
jgi:hypothetical protein